MKTAAVLIGDVRSRGAGHLPSSFVHAAGHLAAKVSPSPGICHPREKNANARGLARGGGAWAQLELTDALVHCIVKTGVCHQTAFLVSTIFSFEIGLN